MNAANSNSDNVVPMGMARTLVQARGYISFLERRVAHLQRLACLFDCQRCGHSMLSCSCLHCPDCGLQMTNGCACLAVDKPPTAS